VPTPAVQITNHLLGLGWKPEGAGLQRDFEYRVDLSGEYGYVWSLQRFTDSDNSEGIAVGRWQDINVEGDTLAELISALDRIAIQASERRSDARNIEPDRGQYDHSSEVE